MTKSTITRERLQELAEGQSGFNLRTATHEESQELARMALAAMESEPVATLDVQSRRPDGNKFALVFSSAAHKLPDDVYFLYRHAQPAPIVPPMQHWEELCREHPDMSIGDAIIRAAWWNHCRAAMLNGGNDE